MHQHISSLQIIPEEMYDTGHLLDHAFLAEKEFTKLIAETFVHDPELSNIHMFVIK